MTDTNPAENNQWGEQFPSPMPAPLPQAPAPFGYGNTTPPPVAPQQPSNPYSQPQQGYGQIPQAPAQGYTYPQTQAPYAQQQPQQGPSPFNNSSYIKPKNSDKLGLVAFIAMVVVAVVSFILSIITGLSANELAALNESTVGLNPDDTNRLAWVGLLLLLNMVGGTIMGVTCLVVGIFAWVKDRGRKWGIAATILSVITPVVSFVLYLGVIAATMA